MGCGAVQCDYLLTCAISVIKTAVHLSNTLTSSKLQAKRAFLQVVHRHRYYYTGKMCILKVKGEYTSDGDIATWGAKEFAKFAVHLTVRPSVTAKVPTIHILLMQTANQRDTIPHESIFSCQIAFCSHTTCSILLCLYKSAFLPANSLRAPMSQPMQRPVAKGCTDDAALAIIPVNIPILYRYPGVSYR
jgi:hypothetical protein